MNYLYYGDNLDVLRHHIADGSVDLVYLDPPFNSNATYNVLFAERDGARSAAQIEAFEDTWRWDEAAVRSYQEAVEAGGTTARALKAMRDLLGDNNLTAYLAMMAPRLLELHRVLAPTGSLYLHCDPTASHYLKLLLDATFGASNFVNEIVWHYNTGGATKRTFSKKHDIVFLYAKDESQRVFNPQREPFREDKTQHFTEKDEAGRKYRVRTIGGKDYVYYLDEGRICHDVWEIDAVNAYARERLGYPTQKPMTLLERIVAASSNPGDVVLDPFCGCGTTIAVAHQLGRRWIGIDVTHLAVGLMKHRLIDLYGEDVVSDFEVWGEPTTVEDAQALAEQDRYQFEWWALGLVGARRNEKRGADAGKDGSLFFHDDRGKTREVVLQVKSGNLTLSAVRDFARVIEREEADIGVLVTMNAPTGSMRAEAAELGLYTSAWGNHPRFQILAIAELLDGARIGMPPAGTSVTFRRAPRAQRPAAEERSLFDES